MKKVFLIISFLLLVFSCKEHGEIVGPVEKSTESFTTIHYIATASSKTLSKATVNGSTQYIFESGDRLFISHVESGEDKLFGSLSLVSGAGERVARFEGDIFCAEDFELSASTPIDVTLVSSNDVIHPVGGGVITDAVSYPSGAWAPDLATAVQRYSDFTCTSTFGSTRFTLSQNSAFVICRIKMSVDELPGATSVSASIESGGSFIWSGDITSTSAGGTSTLDFVVPFAGGEELTSATLSLGWTDALDAQQSHDFPLNSETLAANNYYMINRSTLSFDGFRVKATLDGTTVAFNYRSGPSDGIQYSLDGGSSWEDYSTSISLNTDEEVCFRGKRTSYTNSGSTPLITTNKLVYIYGDIMSLVCDENYVKKTELVANAFKGAFKNCTNINIPTEENLRLSAETLSESCYESMFSGCTALTKAPILPATTMADMCYKLMFYNCDYLTTLPEGFLPAMNLAFGCYWKMFEDCDRLATVPSTLLPATTLATACYARMFYKCKALTSGPNLPALSPAPACYFVMYRNCSALTSVNCMLYLDESQRNGDEITGYYKTNDDPPADQLRTWEICTMWSVFNKWLTSNAGGYTIQNTSSCVFTYNTNVPSSIFSVKIAGANFVPSNWTKTPTTPPTP